MSGPSDRRTEDRLDAMLAPLRDRPAELDELTQARVRGRLEAAIADDVSPANTGKGRGWRVAGVSVGVALGAAAVFAAVVSMMSAKPRPAAVIEANRVGDAPAIASARVEVERATTGDGAATGPGPAGGRSPSIATNAGDHASTRSGTGSGTIAGAPDGITPPIADAANGVAAPIAVAAGQSAQVMVGGAAVTVYGPGRLSPMPDGAVAEGTGVVVDRTEGDRPWSMQYHGATIVAMHATFALDLGNGPRVTVVRGQISLLCSSGMRTIRAGGSGMCPVEEVRAASPSRPQTPNRALDRVSERVDQPLADRRAPAKIDLYGVAEAALGRGDVEAARRALFAVIAAAPGSLDAATALLDLARLAASRGDTADAREYLDALERHPRRTTLAAAAAHLRASLAPAASQPQP